MTRSSVPSDERDRRIAVLESELRSWRIRAERAEADVAGLRTAVTNARRIGAAVGIIMATRKLTNDASFGLLVTASQDQQRKLRDVAEDVLETGLVPLPTAPSRTAEPEPAPEATA